MPTQTAGRGYGEESAEAVRVDSLLAPFPSRLRLSTFPPNGGKELHSGTVFLLPLPGEKMLSEAKQKGGLVTGKLS